MVTAASVASTIAPPRASSPRGVGLIACPRHTNRTAGRSSVSQMEWHARDDGVWLEQERPLDEQRTLVVEQMVPPPRRYELRKHNGDVVVGVVGADPFNVAQQRLHDRAVRGLEHH